MKYRRYNIDIYLKWRERERKDWVLKSLKKRQSTTSLGNRAKIQSKNFVRSTRFNSLEFKKNSIRMASLCMSVCAKVYKFPNYLKNNTAFLR